jgi:hypothetical protein
MAARKATSPHTIDVGTNKYTVLLNKEEYSNVGSLLGIHEISDRNTPGDNSSVSHLVQYGHALPIRCGIKQTGRRIRYLHLICSITHIGTAMNALVGKEIPGYGRITNTGFSRSMRLG